MKYKRILCSILTLCIFTICCRPISAMSIGGVTNSNVQYLAKIAYVQGVNEEGTNLNGDVGNNAITNEYVDFAVVEKEEDLINITTYIGNESVSISGTPIGRSESGKTVFFAPTISDIRYEVVNFAYISDTAVTSLYFENYKNSNYPTETSVLKLYIKDMESETLDYYFIEIFDITLDYQSEKIISLPVNPLLGAWAATQFQPVESEVVEIERGISPMALTSTKNWYCTQTFYDFGDYTTHTISWRTNADYADVPVGQEATQKYRLTVYAKSMNFPSNSDLNSSTSSFLHINSIKLRQTSVRNTAWSSTTFDGEVAATGSYGVTLYVGLGVNFGPLNVALDISSLFTDKTNIDINEYYNGYENGVNGNYTRSIKTTLGDSFRLTNIGHYYYVESVLRDYGNVTQDASTLKATWDVEIMNSSTFETCMHTCEHNVSVAIVD